MKVLRDVGQPESFMDKLGSVRQKAILRIQTEVLKTITERLLEQGFAWILPVMLTKSTDPLWPDQTASIEKRLEVDIYGEQVKTMQSMMIQKRTLVSLGPDRFFILSPNIRIERRERANTGWHLYEFTQLDLEIAQAKMEEVFAIFEDIMKRSVTALIGNMQQELTSLKRELQVPATPFVRYKRAELEKEYGREWENSISEKLSDPAWVTDLPREFYDYEDEATGEWRNFDLLLPEGYGEAISGAEREYEYERILRKLERDRLKREEYDVILKLAKDGRLRPSAGAGLGIERFVAYLCGVEHIGEVQPFPRIPGMVPAI